MGHGLRSTDGRGMSGLTPGFYGRHGDHNDQVYCLCCHTLFAGRIGSGSTLPLPDNLIDLRSEQGEQLLKESDALEAFVPLSVNFVTQKNSSILRRR